MAGAKINVFQSIKTVHSCRLYNDAFRKLFGLPIRKGKIVSVELNSGTIYIEFEIDRLLQPLVGTSTSTTN